MRPSQRIKRAIDVALACLLLLMGAPLLIVVAVLILLLEGRPIFYISRRCVTPDHSIPVIKFRTMVRDANSPKYRLMERFMHEGFLDIPRTCDVYTPIGRILERLQIVELPQLVNVLFHGMSLIGNRPLPPENLRLLQQHPLWKQRFESPGGITGLAQVVGKMWLSPQHRLELEAGYARTYQSGNILKCDLLISFYTICFIVTSKGLPPARAYALVGMPVPALEEKRKSVAASAV